MLWPARAHVIGKDILIPAHGVYWPIMLHAMGFRDDQIPPLLVHGWWNIAGSKISKSLGNSVDPVELADRYGVEALRYYLMADISTGKDADFSEERLRGRYNDELANNVGNLLNRALNMAQKYRSGVVKKQEASLEPLRALAAVEAPRTVADYTEAMEAYQIDAALRSVIGFARTCNQLIEALAPWKLAKDPAQARSLDEILYHLAEALRIIAILLSPVLPNASASILGQLQVSGSARLADTAWGGIADEHQLGSPVPVFPRLEAPPAES